MSTKTFTLLVTITDDEHPEEVHNPLRLADALKGALETGIRNVVIGGEPGQYFSAVASAEVDVLEGDLLYVPLGHTRARRQAERIKALHHTLREGA